MNAQYKDLYGEHVNEVRRRWEAALDAAGQRLAYLRWSHPNMPWDGTRLETATVTETSRDLPTPERALVICAHLFLSVFHNVILGYVGLLALGGIAMITRRRRAA